MGAKPSIPAQLSPEAWAQAYAPLPPTVQRSEELLDGFSLPPHTKRNVVTWRAAGAGAAPPKALVFISHGIHEHMLRYNDLACFLVARGYAVAGLDAYAHGKSEGPHRGACSDAMAIVRDLSTAARAVQARLPPGTPTLLLAHSGGTLAAVRELELKTIPNVCGAFLSALAMKYGPGVASPQGLTSLYWVTQTAFGEWLCSVLARLDPLGGAAPLLLEDLTTDQAEILKIQQDPLRYHGQFRNGLSWEGMKLIRLNRAELHRIDTPIAMHHAREDRICLLESTSITSSGVSSARKVVKVWEGVKHELFFDVRRGEVYEECVAWLDSCVAAVGGGGAAGAVRPAAAP